MTDPAPTRSAAPGWRPEPGPELIRAERLTVRFGGAPVLDAVDVAVRRGEIVTLIGPNGAGKTTLVRAMLGLLTPDDGTVVRAAGLRIGYMPQRLAVDPTLPLSLRRFLRLWGRPGQDTIKAALDAVGARAVLDKPLAALSGGELQRVLLARALMQRPDLLVLDEPIQGVDVTGQAELYRLIAGIRDRDGCGVLLISHDLHLVMARTDHVVCLNRHVCCAGAPDFVTRDPAFTALFGPRARELAFYRHDHDHWHGPGGHVVGRAHGPRPDPVDGPASDGDGGGEDEGKPGGAGRAR